MATPTTADSPLLPRPREHPDFPQKSHHSIAWLPLCLLVVSVFTTASTGALLMRNFRMDQPPLANEGDLFPLHSIWNHPSALASGWSFSLALLGILLAHETGHYSSARRHGISASWPYVLPAPTLSGTAGAVIRIRSRIPSRRALMEWGIAGPIAGYLVALPTTILGILLFAASRRRNGSGSGPVSPAVDGRAPGQDPRGLGSGVPALANLLPHPILIASWVGLLVHLALQSHSRGAVGWRAYFVCGFSPMASPADVRRSGVVAGDGRDSVDRMRVLWGAILLLPAMRHPHVPYFPRLHGKHRWLCVLALALLLLTFLPAPFVGTSIYL